MFSDVVDALVDGVQIRALLGGRLGLGQHVAVAHEGEQGCLDVVQHGAQEVLALLLLGLELLVGDLEVVGAQAHGLLKPVAGTLELGREAGGLVEPLGVLAADGDHKHQDIEHVHQAVVLIKHVGYAVGAQLKVAYPRGTRGSPWPERAAHHKDDPRHAVGVGCPPNDEVPFEQAHYQGQVDVGGAPGRSQRPQRAGGPANRRAGTR